MVRASKEISGLKVTHVSRPKKGKHQTVIVRPEASILKRRNGKDRTMLVRITSMRRFAHALRGWLKAKRLSVGQFTLCEHIGIVLIHCTPRVAQRLKRAPQVENVINGDLEMHLVAPMTTLRSR